MDIWDRLLNEKRPVVLYGTGNGADKIIDILNEKNIKISGIFSSAEFVRNRQFRGIKVSSFNEMKENFPNMLVLMCFGSNRLEVLDFVKKISQENEVLAPDVPVFGENVFNTAFFEEHKTKLNFVKSRLSDDISVNTFEKLIEFKLSGDINKLFSCEHMPYELSDNYKYTYLDFGAYNGDTILEFTQKYRHLEIIAFEPDFRNFRKLRENTAHIDNISYYNALISNKDDITHIDKNKGRGVSESDFGSTIQSFTIDSIIKQIKYTKNKNEKLVIKLDVEGNELKALQGAENTIKTLNPIMFISCYHRSEDYFTLPTEVLRYNDNYNIYMRHYSGIPAWETEYIFIPRK